MSTFLVRLAMLCALLAALRAHAQYVPQEVVIAKDAGYMLPDGSVRVVGLAEMDGVIGKLDDLFVRTHPGIRFTYVGANSLAAMDSLIFSSTAFAPVGITYPSQLTYTDIVHGPPFGVTIAHGSLDAGAKVSPLGVIVNAANPVSTLTMGQVARMFSQQMRSPVIAHWSQAGVKTALGDAEVHPWGLPFSDHYASEDSGFGDFVFTGRFGSQPPVRDYAMARTYAEVVAQVKADPAAVGIVSLNAVTAEVKVVGISEGDFAVPLRGTPADIAGGHYPMNRDLRIYCRITSGKPMDPLAREYLRMALSPEGQAIIAASQHHYIPLSQLEVMQQLASFP